jgi:AcrR family transcriptional regulator
MKRKPKIRSTNSRKDTPDRLLDAAEEVFARSGYDAASIRAITRAARVPLALAHYHFKSKKELFRRVFARRVDELRARRLAVLEKFRDAADGEPIPVDQIVEAFAYPAFELSINGAPGWKNYMKLNAQISISDKYVALVGDLFDPTATTFLKEMRRSLPNASPAAISWTYLFLVAAIAAALAESGRIELLSKSKVKSSQLAQACENVKRVISAGFKALEEHQPEEPEKRASEHPVSEVSEFGAR